MVLGSLMALTQAHDMVATNGSVEALAAKVWRTLERTLRRRPAAARPVPVEADGPLGGADAPEDSADEPTANRSQRSRR